MNLANLISAKGMTIAEKAIVFVLLIGFFVSCYEAPAPFCPSDKNNDSFKATVSQNGVATCLLSSQPCDMGISKLINSIGGDSLTITAGGGNCTGISYVTLLLNNVKSTGEYKFGVPSVPGEPFAVCSYSHIYGTDDGHYSTDPGTGMPYGSGVVTIENLSSDFISGTFHATCIAGDSFNPVETEITLGSFSISLK